MSDNHGQLSCRAVALRTKKWDYGPVHYPHKAFFKNQRATVLGYYNRSIQQDICSDIGIFTVCKHSAYINTRIQ